MNRYTFLSFFLVILGISLATRLPLKRPFPLHFPEPFFLVPDTTPHEPVFMLGRALFYDPVLSADSSVSCATCHQPFAAFAHVDHALAHGIYSRIGIRNVPALQNLAWKKNFMWDGGVEHIDFQALRPITDTNEMAETLPRLLKKLNRSPSYTASFKKAFGDAEINFQRLLKAISRFTASLISGRSRYDEFLAGRALLSDAEQHGLRIIRAKCTPCHAEPLFTDNSFRNNGLRVDSTLLDWGRYRITGIPEDRNKFQVPSLRHVSITFPYMHDGRFRKLKDVLQHYTQSSFPPGTDPEVLKIGPLTDVERKDLIAFLLTLNDPAFLQNPRFANPF